MIIFRKEHSNSCIHIYIFRHVPTVHTVDGRNPAPVEALRLVVSPILQGFIHPRWLFLISEPSTAAILIFRRRTYLMYSGFYSCQHSVGSRHRWYQAAGSKYWFPGFDSSRAKATTLAASHEPRVVISACRKRCGFQVQQWMLLRSRILCIATLLLSG